VLRAPSLPSPKDVDVRDDLRKAVGLIFRDIEIMDGRSRATSNTQSVPLFEAHTPADDEGRQRVKPFTKRKL
jgi:hypothetical protein